MAVSVRPWSGVSRQGHDETGRSYVVGLCPGGDRLIEIQLLLRGRADRRDVTTQRVCISTAIVLLHYRAVPKFLTLL